MADVAAGDRAAFEVLSRRHLRRSLALAYRILNNSADAEEVVQDAFMHVWEHAVNWRGDGSQFSTWLYRIVVNRCLDYRRRRTFAPIEDAVEVPAREADAFTVVQERQLASKVDAAIAALPERQRLALGLSYYADVGCSEAAHILNVSTSAMESLLVRARRAVRSQLRPVVGFAEEDGT